MPVNPRDLDGSRELLRECALDSNEPMVQMGELGPNEQFPPLILYVCKGDSEPGPCRRRRTFTCALGVGDAGVLVETITLLRCQGVCEVQILSNEWVFRDNGAQVFRFAVEPHVLRPVRKHPERESRRGARIDRAPSIVCLEIVATSGRTGHKPNTLPRFNVVLLMEVAADSSPSLALPTFVDLNKPLPMDKSHVQSIAVHV